MLDYSVCKSSLPFLYLLSTLHVTCVINLSRPSTTFLYCKWRKARREQLGFCIRLKDLHSFWALPCFGVLWIIFQTLDILPPWDKLVSQAFSVHSTNCISYHSDQKQSALQNRKGPACETKPTVCKCKRKQMLQWLFSKKQDLMVPQVTIWGAHTHTHTVC